MNIQVRESRWKQTGPSSCFIDVLIHGTIIYRVVSEVKKHQALLSCLRRTPKVTARSVRDYSPPGSSRLTSHH